MMNMAIIVKKFGGTSVGNIDLIRNIAHKLAGEYHEGDSLVLVVSAMAKTTDELFNLAYGITQHPSRRELDMLLTAGERISMSLLSLALMEEGIQSISFTGSQSGIITDNKHGNARILKVNAFRIHEELAKGKVVIVAGFQGVSQEKEITTLGRGGSDTSAVALACYLGAEKCEIFTDVDGVFTADPRIVKNPKLIKEIDSDLMLTLCHNGSKVLHPRAVEFACKYNVNVEVKSSYTFAPGSLMSNHHSSNTAAIDINKEQQMEERTVTAIAHKDMLICYKLQWSQDLLALLKTWHHEVFKYNLEADILEMFIEAKYEPEIDYLLNENKIIVISKQKDLAFVILVGMGLGYDPAFMAETMQLCAPYNVLRCQNTDKSLELLLPTGNVSAAVNTLHTAFIDNRK